MKKEGTRLHTHMARLASHPKGLMSTEFPPYSGAKVNSDLQPYVRKEWVTITKQGHLNVYTVSREQHAAYLAFNFVPPKKKHSEAGDATVIGRLLTLAARTGGVGLEAGPDVSMTRERLASLMSKLHKQGRVIRVSLIQGSRYFGTQADADAFKAQLQKPRSTSSIPATFRFCEPRQKAHAQTKESARAKWNATPPHLPYDDAGRPLWKLTICPGFTADPRYSNTHSQTA